jgi:hypothetical protein
MCICCKPDGHDNPPYLIFLITCSPVNNSGIILTKTSLNILAAKASAAYSAGFFLYASSI